MKVSIRAALPCFMRADVTVSGLSTGVRMAGSDVGDDRTLNVISGGSLTGTNIAGNFTNTNTSGAEGEQQVNSGLNVTVSGDSTITVTTSDGSTSNGLSVKSLTIEDGGDVSVSGTGRYGVTATEGITVNRHRRHVDHHRLRRRGYQRCWR